MENHGSKHITPLHIGRGRGWVSFYIARRYLFSKKSTHAINVISGISVVGVAVATMALVVTLSVFNGFHDLVASFLTSFDPQLKVTPVKGKSVAADDPRLTQIRELPQVDVATECLEDQALALYDGHQAMVTLKGVDDNFDQLTHIGEILVGDGQFELHAADMHYGLLGIRLAETLNTGYMYDHPLKIFAPRREGQFDMSAPEESFIEDELYSPGVLFCVRQAKYDKNYIITSLGFARRVFEQQGMISVTRVETTGDLRYAKVWLSVLGLKSEKEFMKGLRSAGGWLRHELGQRMALRYTPELVFELDRSIEYGAHINELINSLNISEDDGETEEKGD